jgi:hypothetical protein
MKSFYVFLALLCVLIAVYVFTNTNHNRNVSVLNGSSISQDGKVILKDGAVVNPSK